MKNIKAILALSFLSLALLSCEKELDESQLVYVGEWEDFPDHRITINQNGRGEYRYMEPFGPGSDISFMTVEGLVRVNNEFITIGVNQRFTISQEPTVDSFGNTFMILDDNQVYFRNDN